MRVSGHDFSDRIGLLSGGKMKVKELIDYLERCNPEAVVYLGEMLKDGKELNHVVEVGVSDLIIPTVYLS